MARAVSPTSALLGLNFKVLSREEMNANPQIRRMIANTGYRAAQNFKEEIDPTFIIKPELYKCYDDVPDVDLPEVKDSNIKPEEMLGFVLEDRSGRVVSIILAGISKKEEAEEEAAAKTVIMMGTIDTLKESQGHGYFSILFDKTIECVAREKGDFPEVLISQRGVTTKGNNFPTYFHLMKSRGLDVKIIPRTIGDVRPKYTAESIFEMTAADLAALSKEDLTTTIKGAQTESLKQPNEAIFIYGTFPREKTIEGFAAESRVRLENKTRTVPASEPRSASATSAVGQSTAHHLG